ncbi:MAG: Pyruvate kinase [Candidatus Accumulibacter sp. BA-94]|nr:MAG: Pyruvate kinase [Candidatus Accumulibacter sp. BA-94]
MRRTKIVATIGPATSEMEPLRQLLEAGVDVVRLNAAHADMETHSANVRRVRELSQVLGRSIGTLVDLPGPKIRSGIIVNGEVELANGQEFILSGSDDGRGDERHVATTLSDLAHWVLPNDDVYLADGAIVLRVIESLGNDVRTEVVRGGTLRSRKGMHLPRAEAHVEPFTERDALALEMAIAAKVDFIGLSFVRRAEDVERVRAMLPKRGVRPALVPKIETAAAIDNLDGIVRAADAVMVARGDLGIQMPARHPDAGPQRAALAERDHSPLQPGGETGDHRDADARVDDPLAAADARRGQRRRQRRPRRHRCADAFRGNRRRPLPEPDRAHDERSRRVG